MKADDGAIDDRRAQLRRWSIVGRVLVVLWIGLGLAIACGVGVPESASLSLRIIWATMTIGTAAIPAGCVKALQGALHDRDGELDGSVR